MSKKILSIILRYLSRQVLQRYHPLVIGITGSVGKTSAKEAIFTVLTASGRVRKSEKNFNNELGTPLTILGEDKVGGSLSGWWQVFRRAWQLSRGSSDYPDILVLEMGADRVGDIGYLMNLAQPKIGVLTTIGPSHLEYFKNLQNVVQEKSTIVTNLSADGVAVMNLDDPLIATLLGKPKCRVITYGFDVEADVRALDWHLTQREGIFGLNFKVQYQGTALPLFIPHLVGKHQISACLAALAVAVSQGINIVTAAQRLSNFKAPLGRMNLIEGIKNSLIIDDTYNASPQSTVPALETLRELGEQLGATKYALLGDMLELGHYSQAAHNEVGQAVVKAQVDYLLTVGKMAEDIAVAAEKAGLERDRIFTFQQATDIEKFLIPRLKPSSVILIKGSQGTRMEKAAKVLLKEPLQAEKLLVRQTGEWLRK